MVTLGFPDAIRCLIDNRSPVSERCLSQYFHGSTAQRASGIDGSRRSTKAMSDSLTFRLLVYIKAVAEAQNFTRAASQLYLAQPSLSHQILELESQLKLQIFERGGSSIRVTDAGRLLVTHERITASHTNLLARLPQEAKATAYEECWRKDWQDKEPHLLPAKHLSAWIQSNLYLSLADAPFDREDPTLNRAAGACITCPRRSGYNTALFIDVQGDQCLDSPCYQMKINAHIDRGCRPPRLSPDRERIPQPERAETRSRPAWTVPRS